VANHFPALISLVMSTSSHSRDRARLWRSLCGARQFRSLPRGFLRPHQVLRSIKLYFWTPENHRPKGPKISQKVPTSIEEVLAPWRRASCCVLSINPWQQR
jgi:hypothetical protein